jgi:hypothetical protein
MKGRLVLLPQNNKVAKEGVLAAAPHGRLLACDFYIAGAENWNEKAWGYENGRLVNIDHHADTPAMRRYVSSANLALKYVHENGVAKENETVVINHTDCDSVLSAAIVRGDVEADVRFGEAAIAADHTGEENSIADLLQALDARRDYEYSLDQLRSLLSGGVLDEDAKIALVTRHQEREEAARLVQAGAFEMQDGIAWTQLETRIGGELFMPLLPQMKLIVMFYPNPEEPGKWLNKVRLGNAAPDNFSMHQLIEPFDKNFGGRWNAGSNKRGGGSTLAPQKYIAHLLIAQG